jgi:hypothetical protein
MTYFLVLLLLMMVGPLFFIITKQRYADIDRHHEHESITQSSIDGLEKEDTLIEHCKGKSSKSIGEYRFSYQDNNSIIKLHVSRD